MMNNSQKNVINPETTSVVLIVTAIIHLIILIINFQNLGFWPVAGAIFLFTIILFAGIVVLQWILPIVGVVLAGGIVWSGYNIGSWEGAFKNLLFAIAFVVVLAILVFIGPPILSGYVVYLVYDTIFWAIVVGIVFAIAWFIFVKYAPWAVLALFAGGIANKITLIILGSMSFEYYKNDLLTIGNNLNVHSFDNLLSLILKIVDLIDLSWYMVIWCLALGVVYKYVKDKDNKIESV